MEKDKEKPDVPRAIAEWDRICHVLEALGSEILEIPPVKGAQDQTFVSNVAVSIKPYIVLAKMSAPGRPVEEAPSRTFFESIGYKVIQPPFVFEGFAELKQLNDKLYFGGYGEFTDIRALKWIEQQTGITVIPIKEINRKLYHLDTMLMVLDEETVMVTRSGMDADSFRLVKAAARVIEAPSDVATAGITNGLLLKDKRIYCSGCLQPEDPKYQKAMDFLLETMDGMGLSTIFFDTEGIGPSGGDLSCQFLPLTF